MQTSRKTFESNEYYFLSLRFLNSKHNKHKMILFHRFPSLNAREKNWIIITQRREEEEGEREGEGERGPFSPPPLSLSRSGYLVSVWERLDARLFIEWNPDPVRRLAASDWLKRLLLTVASTGYLQRKLALFLFVWSVLTITLSPQWYVRMNMEGTGECTFTQGREEGIGAPGGGGRGELRCNRSKNLYQITL